MNIEGYIAHDLSFWGGYGMGIAPLACAPMDKSTRQNRARWLKRIRNSFATEIEKLNFSSGYIMGKGHR